MSSNDRKIQTASLVTLSGLISLIVFFAGANSAFADTYASPGTYTYTVGNYGQLDVQIAGGGGGGGGWGGGYNYWAAVDNNYFRYPGANGGAGAAGGYTHVTIPVSPSLPVSPGQQITFYVGGGGAGGNFSYNGFSGGGGGSSYFNGYIVGGGGGGGGAVGCDGDNSCSNFYSSGGGGGGGGAGAGENAPGTTGVSGGYGYGSGGAGSSFWGWPVWPANDPSVPVRGGVGSTYGGNGGGSATVTATIFCTQYGEFDGTPTCIEYYPHFTYTSGLPGSLGSANGGSVVTGGGGAGGAGSSGIYGNGGSGGNGYVIITQQNPVAGAPNVTVSFSPSSIPLSGSTFFSWSSTNTTYCNVSHPDGSGAWNGAPTSFPAPNYPDSYGWFSGSQYPNGLVTTITCFNGAGASAAQSATLTIIPTPTATLTASPTSVPYNGGSTLTWWSSTNATSCTAGGPWSNSGTLSGSGWTGALTASSYTFTFQCTGPGGTSPLQSVTVTVAAPPASCTPATTISNCYLPVTDSGSPAGSCSSGYTGVCNYTCTEGGVWSQNSNSCTAIPTGTLTLSPTSCVIASDASTCSTVYATWTTTNAPSPALVDGNTGTTLSSLANQASPGLQVWVAYPQTVFNLKNSSTILDTKTASASCISGTAWNSSSGKCLPSQISGTISASPNPCTVAIGGNTCSTSLTWNTSNVPNPNVYSSYTSGTLSAASSGSNLSATVAYAGTTFSVRNSNSVLNSVIVTGACASGSTWNGSSCVVSSCGNGANNPPACNAFPPSAPTVMLTATPDMIGVGQSSLLTWTSSNASSCTAVGGFSTGGATSNSTGVSVSPSATSNYQIYCDGAGGRTYSNIAIVTVSQSAALISADPMRVHSGDNSQISWSAVGVNSCVVTGPSGTLASGNANVSHNFSTGSPRSVPITGQSTFTITCQTSGSPVSKSVTVNILALFQEF